MFLYKEYFTYLPINTIYTFRIQVIYFLFVSYIYNLICLFINKTIKCFFVCVFRRKTVLYYLCPEVGGRPAPERPRPSSVTHTWPHRREVENPLFFHLRSRPCISITPLYINSSFCGLLVAYDWLQTFQKENVLLALHAHSYRFMLHV